MSLWDDAEIKKTIDLMDPATRYAYARVGQRLYQCGGPIDLMTEKTDPECDMFESATQLELALRDGMEPEMLTESEKIVLVNAYGEDAVKERFGIVIPKRDDQDDLIKLICGNQNEQTDSRRVLEHYGENKGPAKNIGKIKRGGEGDNDRVEGLSKSDGRGRTQNRRKYRNYADKQRQEDK
jgi:hypothetical protein